MKGCLIMKVKIVIYSTLNESGGGRETWIQYFMKELLIRNYQLEVFCLNDKTINSIDKKKEYKNVVFEKSEFHVGSKFNVFNFIKMTKKKLALKHNRDTVYLFLGTVVEGTALLNLKKQISNAFCIVWARSINSNEIAHRHSRLISFIPQYIEKKTIKMSNHVITNGSDTLTFYKNKYDLADKCSAIPNAIEIKNFQFQYKILKNYPCAFLYLGRFCEIKGVYDILKAFNDIELNEKYYCNIYGHGNDLSSYVINKNCKIRKEVSRNDVISIYSNSNISFFLGKGSEFGGGGLSHSLLEALASGHICICYDIPAYNQIIINGHNGILLPYLDIKSVENCVRTLITNKNSNYYKNMQIHARLTAKEHSVENHVDTFVDLVTEKIGGANE